MATTTKWWTVAELAAYWQTSPKTVRRHIKTGKLVAHRLGGLRVSDDNRIAFERSRQTVKDLTKGRTWL